MDGSWRWLYSGKDGKSMMQSKSGKGFYFYSFLHQHSTSSMFIQSNVQKTPVVKLCFRRASAVSKNKNDLFKFLTFEILILLSSDRCHLKVIMPRYLNMDLKFASIPLVWYELRFNSWSFDNIRDLMIFSWLEIYCRFLQSHAPTTEIAPMCC